MPFSIPGFDFDIRPLRFPEQDLFSEDKVEIFREYLPGNLPAVLHNVQTELARITTTETIQVRPSNSTARRVNKARKGLHAFLQRITEEHTNAKEHLDLAYREFKNTRFKAAREAIAKIKPIHDLHEVSFSTIRTALTSSKTDYTEKTVIQPIPGDGPLRRPAPVEIPRSLDGYRRPRLNQEQLQKLYDFTEFLKGGPEWVFRKDLFEAESYRFEENFLEAVDRYTRLLNSPSDLSVDRRKFVAIQSGFAHVAWGDRDFRRAHTQGEEALTEAEKRYDNALEIIIEQFGPGPWANPLVMQVVTHANGKLLCIELGLNYLGYSDSHVPTRTYRALFDQASRDAATAVDIEERYLRYFRSGEDLDEATLALQQNAKNAEFGVQSAIAQQNLSGRRVRQIDDGLRAIEEKLELHDISSGISFLAQSFSIASSPGFGGLVSGLMNDTARRQELEHSKRALGKEKLIAQGEEAIRRLEVERAEQQVAFIENALSFISNRGLNADLYYKLAVILDRVRQDYLDGGIRFGYLAERALAFEFGKPDLPKFVDFDYKKEESKLAGTLLKGDLDRLNRHRLQLLEATGKNHSTGDEYSLRKRFPVEFSRFIDTGTMDFAISLYDFETEHPGSSHVQIQDVKKVQVVGLTGPEGISGKLIHFGTFFMRDKDATMQPDVGRLLPTEEELEDALEKLEQGDAQAATAGGVTIYRLEEAVAELSSSGEILPGEAAETRGVFEGYGPNGLWRLMLPKDANDFDFRSIADIEIHFTFSGHKIDLDITEKVQRLIRDYEEEMAAGEQLDRVTVFSMRQHFPDAFFSLGSSDVSFEIREELLDRNLTELKVKSVVMRAVDEDGKGVEGIQLHVSNEDGSLRLEEVTLADGFTVDLDTESFPILDSLERVPLVDTWQLTLPDTSQAESIQDLFLFFMYAYKKVGS